MREAHLLKKTIGVETPVNWIFFDVETISETITDKREIALFKLGIARYYRRTKTGQLAFQREKIFRESNELSKFISGVTRSKNNLMLVAHNITFDMLAGKLFYSFPEQNIQLTSFYKKGMTSIFRYENETSNITAIDTGNFFTTSLEEIGKLVGRPKLAVDFKTVDEETLIDYCRNDVLIIVDAIEYWLKFLRENNFGAFKNTIASTAMNIFRRNFMKYDIWLHDDEKVINLERESYHGGRVEMYYSGYFNSQKYYQLDVNSMYPYICAEYEYPVKLMPNNGANTLARLADKLERYAVIAKVRLCTNEPAYPLVKNGRIFYPVGEFVTTLSTPELKYALAKNHILQVLDMSIYQQFRIFQEYMETIYELRMKYRQEGNVIFDKICKLLGNSLYGKWGARDYQTERVKDNLSPFIGVVPEWNVSTGINYDWYYFPDSVFRVWQEGIAYHAFPAIAAHVTAYGRMMNYQYTQTAKRVNTYYTDTDGFWVNEQGFKNLVPYIDDNKLGALKIEDTSSFIEIKSPKSYTVENKWKSKGIRQSALQIAENTYTQPTFFGLNGMLRHNRLDGVFIDQTTKHNKNLIFSGYPTQSGLILPPLAVPQSADDSLIHGLMPTGFQPVFELSELIALGYPVDFLHALAF